MLKTKRFILNILIFCALSPIGLSAQKFVLSYAVIEQDSIYRKFEYSYNENFKQTMINSLISNDLISWKNDYFIELKYNKNLVSSIIQRKDGTTTNKENFTYDEHNLLTDYRIDYENSSLEEKYKYNSQQQIIEAEYVYDKEHSINKNKNSYSYEKDSAVTVTNYKFNTSSNQYTPHSKFTINQTKNNHTSKIVYYLYQDHAWVKDMGIDYFYDSDDNLISEIAYSFINDTTILYTRRIIYQYSSDNITKIFQLWQTEFWKNHIRIVSQYHEKTPILESIAYFEHNNWNTYFDIEAEQGASNLVTNQETIETFWSEQNSTFQYFLAASSGEVFLGKNAEFEYIEASIPNGDNLDNDADKPFVYPNPSPSGLFNISNFSFDSYIISNSAGQTITTLEPSNNSNIIDISSQPAGIYFLTLYSKNNSTTIKLIKSYY